MLQLQQFLGKPQRGAEAQGGVGHQGASPYVSKLGAAIVDGRNHADDVAALRLLEQVFEVANDGAIWLRPYELQDV